MCSVILLGVNNLTSKQWVCLCPHSAVGTTPRDENPVPCDQSQTHSWTYKSQIFDDQGISSKNVFPYRAMAEPVINSTWL